MKCVLCGFLPTRGQTKDKFFKASGSEYIEASDSTRRYRHCPKCRRSFKTIEVSQKQWDQLHDQIQELTGLLTYLRREKGV